MAILASLVVHILSFVGWQHRTVLGRMAFFRPLVKVLTAAPVHRPKVLPATPTITFVQEPAPQRQFIETDTSQVTGEEPKNARFYSDNSTMAANPQNPSGKDGDTPYLDGSETRMLSTANVRPQPPGAPAAPPATPQPVTQKPAEPVKELAATGMKVVEEKKETPEEKPVTPPARKTVAGSNSRRELAAAKSRATSLGVRRLGVEALNVASSPFGAYDKALIYAVQSRWYEVLNTQRMDTHTGTVELKFDLLADGSVANMEMKANSAGPALGLYCQKAVVESAPFAPLPEDLQRLIGGDSREIIFTFYY